MDTSQEVTSDEDTEASCALDSRVQVELSDDVQEKKITKDRQQKDTAIAKQLYQPDFGWMTSLFEDMS